MEIRKLVLCDGKKLAWREGDLHTRHGFLKAEDIEKGGRIKTNKGKELIVLEPNFYDLTNLMKRGPQMPLQKDVAVLMYYSGIGKDSKVLDAGSGTGLLACSIARIAKEVVSYEVKENHYLIAKKNADFFGLNNLRLVNKDIGEGIEEKDFDAITLDLAEPWDCLEHAKQALKLGGTIATYLPSIKQVERLVAEANNLGLLVMDTIEILERGWLVKKDIVRPSHDMYGHTAFLTFLRKI